MSSRQLQQLIQLALRFFSKLSFATQVVIVMIALAGFGTWLHLHKSIAHPHARTGQASAPAQHQAPASTKADAGDCSDKLPYGEPVLAHGPATSLGPVRVVCRTGYVLGHSATTKTPLWVAERLTADDIDGAEERTDEFMEDPEIPVDERATLKDYRGSGDDRGHMAPAADFSRSAKEMAESFYLSNMVPQAPKNNRGPWAMLEKAVRKSARKSGEVFVNTGPQFPDSGYATIGPGHVGVPERLYKVELDDRRGIMSAWMLPNTNDIAKTDWNKYCTSVAEVEKATGLTFFPKMPAERRAKLVAMSCAL